MTIDPIGTRRLRASVDLLDTLGSRTADGSRLTFEWGEPDGDGVYTPTVTRHDDDNLVVAERARIRAAVEGLSGECHDGEGLGCNEYPCVENVSRAAVLAVIDGEPA